MVSLSVNISPAAAVAAGCHALVNGVPVVDGSSVDVPLGSLVTLSLELDGGFELDNWNNGEWFDPDWQFLAVSDGVFTAFLS